MLNTIIATLILHGPTTLAILFTFSILILFHEFGHFFACKRIGVRVEKFSLGFGPKLFGFKKGETEYCLSLIPLGGYVKMTGEDPHEKLKGKRWEFLSQNIPRRAVIIFSGPLANLLLAFLLFSLVPLIGIKIPVWYTNTTIGTIEEESPAQKADLKIGDRILALGGEKINDWYDISLKVGNKPGKKLEILLLREGEEIKKYLTPEIDKTSGAIVLGMLPDMPMEVGHLTPDYPAQKAGLKVGDKIIGINGQKISQWSQASQIIHDSANKKLEFEIKRQERRFTVNIIPKLDKRYQIGLIGIGAKEATKRVGFLSAIEIGTAQTWHSFNMSCRAIWMLVSGRISPREAVGGPILIGQLVGQAAKMGMVYLFNLIATISVFLMIVNLLPIPLLDGGHIIFLALEGIRKKPLGIRAQEITQQIGLAIILFIAVFVIYNDLVRIWSR
ncbi:Regulator of sigma-E protease RseP [subsurface metagenome]